MTDSTPSPNRAPMIILSYLWLLALVPLLVEKRDAEVQWHAKHGLVLTAAEVIFWVAYTVVMNVFTIVTFGLGAILWAFTPLIWLAFVAVHIVGIVKGLNGDRFKIKYVSEYADRF